MPQKSDPYFSQVPLKEIEIHQTIKKHQGIVNTYHLLKQANRFTREGVMLLLAVHPIHVIKKNKKFFCITGIRQLNIATMCLDMEASIPVRPLNGLSGEQVNDLCLADLFLTPLIFSVDNAIGIDAIRREIGAVARKWTTLADCSKAELAKALGLSTTALYYDRKTTKRG